MQEFARAGYSFNYDILILHGVKGVGSLGPQTRGLPQISRDLLMDAAEQEQNTEQMGVRGKSLVLKECGVV